MVWLGAALLAAPGAADESALRTRTAQLQMKLGSLQARADAKYAKGALEQARRALATATGPTEDPDAVGRAQDIASAAIVLAERQLERRLAQARLFETQRRLNVIRERANAQRRVLEALMRERAALARTGGSP